MGVNWKNDAYEYARDIFKTTGVPFGTQQALQDPNSPLNQPDYIKFGVEAGISIFSSFLGITKNYIGSRGEGTDPVADSELAGQIQGDIKKIFSKYSEQGINDLDSLEAYYENQKLEKIELENTIAENTKSINALTGRNNEITSKIKSLEGEIDDLEGQTDANDEIKAKKEKIEELKKKKEKNDETIKEAEGAKEKAKTKLDKINLEAIEQDINNVKALMRQLKKANGEEAIENLVNEDTDNFSKKIKDLIRAISTGDKEKIGRAAKEVKTAYNAYKEKYGDEEIPSQIKRGWEQAQNYLPKE